MGYTVALHLCATGPNLASICVPWSVRFVAGSGAVGVREKYRSHRKVHAVILDCETVCVVFTATKEE